MRRFYKSMIQKVEGELTTERSFKKFRSLGPMLNLPLIKEGGDVMIEEFGD